MNQPLASIFGAAAGAAIVGAAFYGLTSYAFRTRSQGSVRGMAQSASVVGAGVGAVVGALVPLFL